MDSLPAEPQGKPKNTGVDSLSLLQGIFLTQELSWGLLHCRWILYQLSYQGSPGHKKKTVVCYKVLQRDSQYQADLKAGDTRIWEQDRRLKVFMEAGRAKVSSLGRIYPAPPGRKLEAGSEQRLNQMDSRLWDLRRKIKKHRSLTITTTTTTIIIIINVAWVGIYKFNCEILSLQLCYECSQANLQPLMGAWRILWVETVKPKVKYLQILTVWGRGPSSRPGPNLVILWWSPLLGKSCPYTSIPESS